MILPREERKKFIGSKGDETTYPTIWMEVNEEDKDASRHEISVVDINDSGMGISCELPLKVGQQLKFAEDQEDWELPSKGIVMWTFKASDGFRAGIKFV